MNTRQERASEIVKVVLRSAKARMRKLKGDNRIALEKEYKEWIHNPFFNDDVWFSTDKNLSEYIE